MHAVLPLPPAVLGFRLPPDYRSPVVAHRSSLLFAIIVHPSFTFARVPVRFWLVAFTLCPRRLRWMPGARYLPFTVRVLPFMPGPAIPCYTTCHCRFYTLFCHPAIFLRLRRFLRGFVLPLLPHFPRLPPRVPAHFVLMPLPCTLPFCSCRCCCFISFTVPFLYLHTRGLGFTRSLPSVLPRHADYGSCTRVHRCHRVVAAPAHHTAFCSSPHCHFTPRITHLHHCAVLPRRTPPLPYRTAFLPPPLRSACGPPATYHWFCSPRCHAAAACVPLFSFIPHLPLITDLLLVIWCCLLRLMQSFLRSRSCRSLFCSYVVGDHFLRCSTFRTLLHSFYPRSHYFCSFSHSYRCNSTTLPPLPTCLPPGSRYRYRSPLHLDFTTGILPHTKRCRTLPILPVYLRWVFVLHFPPTLRLRLRSFRLTIPALLRSGYSRSFVCSTFDFLHGYGDFTDYRSFASHFCTFNVLPLPVRACHVPACLRSCSPRLPAVFALLPVLRSTTGFSAGSCPSFTGLDSAYRMPAVWLPYRVPYVTGRFWSPHHLHHTNNC